MFHRKNYDPRASTKSVCANGYKRAMNIDLFCGVGGFTLGGAEAGFGRSWESTSTPNFAVIGGPPCQGLSRIGKRSTIRETCSKQDCLKRTRRRNTASENSQEQTQETESAWYESLR